MTLVTQLLALLAIASVTCLSDGFVPLPPWSKAAGMTCRGHCSVTTFHTFLSVSKSSEVRQPETASITKEPSLEIVPFYQRIKPLKDESKQQPSSLSSATNDASDQQPQNSSPSFFHSGDPAVWIGASVFSLMAVVLGASLDVHTDLSLADLITWFHQLVAHPKETLEAGVDAVQAMGPAGAFVFGLIYCVAEVLAVPATPLTLSAGYLFGVVQGTAIVLLAATCAASVAFFIGKTFLRTRVEESLTENPKFAKLDKAIGKEGFKLLLLVRLSPIFPFALSNYLYGASSIDFASYFWGTLLGFAPGTVAYVYTGMVGKALTLGGGESSEPWYVYAGGFAILATFLKLASDVASGIVEAIDQEDDQFRNVQ